MKIEVMKYNSSKDYEIVIDGKKFDETTVYDGIYDHGAYAAYILKKKFGAKLISGGGCFLTSDIRFIYNGKTHVISLGHDHNPESLRYFLNVIGKHIGVFSRKFEEIPRAPIVTLEI